MKNGIRMTKNTLPKVRAAVNALVKRDVLVGVPSEKTARSGEKITNASLAYIHDNGSPAANIPARPFIVPGLRAAQPQTRRYMKQAAAYALNGDLPGAERALHAAGLTASTAIKNAINTGDFEPLAPATIAGRLRRGRTGTHPLIDTAQMRNAITYIVRKR